MLNFKEFVLENLEPGIQLHTELNPLLWDDFELKPIVRSKLLDIAAKFIEFLNVNRAGISDIIITGSNCSFTYTKFSDIDLHIVFNEKLICDTCSGDFLEDCFWAKKQIWNDNHQITVMGYTVELYSQKIDGNLVANGIYSLINSDWISRPQLHDDHIDSDAVTIKTEDFIKQIDDLVDNKATDLDNLNKLKTRLSDYRQSGLEKSGELSVENLVIKTLRNNGYIKKLYNYIQSVEDSQLSY